MEIKSLVVSASAKTSTLEEFYQKLSFATVSDNPVIVSDGAVYIELSDYKFHRSGFKFYKEKWDVSALEKLTHITEIAGGYLCSDSGIWIYLMDRAGPSVSDEKVGASTLGNFAGGSAESTDMDRSIEFYSLLGFKQTMGGKEQGWVAMTNQDGFTMSIMKPLMCPHVFYNPSVSYFNGGKNIPVIEKIRGAGVPFTQEITEFNSEGIVDNVIIQDPGGFGFFVFND